MCALLTGQITNWDDPALAASNPGVTLPNLPVIPVTQSDPEGTSYVLEQWGLGPNVYNPSTYSYLLTPTAGSSSAKGQTLSEFVDYALTLGQQVAPDIGYAPLGQSLEEYGLSAVQNNAPGAVPPTAAEQTAIDCGDLTPAEVAAGQTTPTCGVANGNPGNGLPEASYVVVFPVLALAAFGGVFTARDAESSQHRPEPREAKTPAT